MSPSGNMHSH